jgi:hypothetical protein
MIASRPTDVTPAEFLAYVNQLRFGGAQTLARQAVDGMKFWNTFAEAVLARLDSTAPRKE